jgi:hypothetical protein
MRSSLGRRGLLLAVSASALLIFGVGTAVAVFPDDNVTTYTGCLNSGGNIINVKAGDSPLQPCSSPRSVVKLSGGDITKVQVTGALTGGGDNGTVTIGLDPKATVPSSCADGQLVRWDGTSKAWVCRDKYGESTGIDLGSDDKSFSVEESYRLPQNCESGEAAIRNPAVGGNAATWTCGQFANANQNCASGQFAKGVTATGTLSCSAPSASSNAPPAFEAKNEARIVEDEDQHEVVRLQLPAGRYAVNSTGDVSQADLPNHDIFGTCLLTGPGGFDIGSYSFEEGNVPLGGIFTLSAAGSIAVTCSALGDDPSEAEFEIVAITVS